MIRVTNNNIKDRLVGKVLINNPNERESTRLRARKKIKQCLKKNRPQIYLKR